ncbi:S41 family peptidase [Novosphingobium malaysiense]|uniref:Tail specific protease domain-containing protein n=1 Tax=Novosphingobium malaysiense TaxID=1348853 RepID=A0A0B1ZJV3_9SPHN|nr:S41 family peptidase [Novosphingobium malaysiense]KHK89548.1 hypothetical protein LK12_20860 [Novosphingobium malaysiense]
MTQKQRKKPMFKIASLSIAAVLAAATALVALPLQAADHTSACNSVESESADAAACTFAGMLERMYTFPELGARYAAALREGVAQGHYSGSGKQEVASAMSRDLQAVSVDNHLRVIAPSQAAAPAKAESAAPAKPEFPIIEQPGWIAPGIAYMRINEFPDDPAVTRQVAAFMTAHADANALIFDLRTHHGGGLDQIDAILPWLYSRPTRLLTMVTSQATEKEFGSPVEGVASLRTIPDERMAIREHWVTPNDRTSLRKARVYLLTGPRTASAAEHFALALKRTHRATLVGQSTRGANHFGGQVDLPGGFTAFLPVGRTYDPETGLDWEGDGIAPDVAVSTEEALEWVLTDMGLSSADAEALSASHEPTLPMGPRPPA